MSHVRHQRRKHGLDSLQGELRKINPPSFDGEREREDDVEAWLLGCRRYFQLHNYSSNLETKIATYHLHGKDAVWWDQLKTSLESKQPCFNVILPFSFTIKGWCLELPQLSLQTIYLFLPSLLSDRGHFWTSYGIIQCIKIYF